MKSSFTLLLEMALGFYFTLFGLVEDKKGIEPRIKTTTQGCQAYFVGRVVNLLKAKLQSNYITPKAHPIPNVPSFIREFRTSPNFQLRRLLTIIVLGH
jgi:hypothetical protein